METIKQPMMEEAKAADAEFKSSMEPELAKGEKLTK